MKTKKWELREIILIGILGTVFSAIYLAIFNFGMVISSVLTPFGLANFGFELIYGVWFMAATMAAYIIRKPGIALLAEVAASAIELLMGNPGGMTVVLTGLIQGLGCELVFAATRYKKWKLSTMCLSGCLAALFIFCYELYYLQYYLLSPVMLAGQLLVRFISASVFSGLIVKLAGDGLAKTGVLKSYALGMAVKAPKIYDEEEA